MIKHLKKCVSSSLLFLCGMLAIGCAEPTEGTLTGTITLDGQPAETGYIGFVPIDGKSGTAGAKVVEGKYTAKVALGSYRVQIRVPKVVGEQKLYNTPDSPVQQVMAESLPPWYNDETELEVEVVPGETIQDYELSTSNKRKK